jgi:hypothetical protein
LKHSLYYIPCFGDIPPSNPIWIKVGQERDANKNQSPLIAERGLEKTLESDQKLLSHRIPNDPTRL